MKLLVTAPLSDKFQKAIHDLSPEIEIVFASPDEPLPTAALRDAEVLYATHVRFQAEEAPNLKWIQLDTAAANQLSGQPILSTSIPIATVRGAYSVAVAECTVSMLLAMSRRIPKACLLQSEREWDDVGMQGEDLFGKTAGIIGYGSIGRQIARILTAMGMRVLACKRESQVREYSGYALPNTGDESGQLPAEWYSIEQLPEMLPQCDVAISTLPLTPHTKRMIGERELSCLPNHAYFLNVGRGGVVDETALLNLLQSGSLAGAALDVFEIEPLPPHSPLWNAPNLLVMPHVASWTTAQSERSAAVLLENLKRNLAGEPLLNIIDKKWMY